MAEVEEARDEQGGKGKRHKGEEGKMGKKTSKNKEGLYGLKGPKDNPDPHLAKKLAEEQAKNAGMLGVLKATEGSHIASIFGRDSALGNDAAERARWPDRQRRSARPTASAVSAWSARARAAVAPAKAPSASATSAPSARVAAAATARATAAAPAASAVVAPTRRTSSPAQAQGARLARQGDHPPHHPAPHQRGEVLLRAGAHEEARARRPHHGAVHHLAASGQVVASVVQNSTMGNAARRASAPSRRVRRWEFPKPLGGGIVIVSLSVRADACGRWRVNHDGSTQADARSRGHSGHRVRVAGLRGIRLQPGTNQGNRARQPRRRGVQEQPLRLG